MPNASCVRHGNMRSLCVDWRTSVVICVKIWNPCSCISRYSFFLLSRSDSTDTKNGQSQTEYFAITSKSHGFRLKRNNSTAACYLINGINPKHAYCFSVYSYAIPHDRLVWKCLSILVWRATCVCSSEICSSNALLLMSVFEGISGDYSHVWVMCISSMLRICSLDFLGGGRLHIYICGMCAVSAPL